MASQAPPLSSQPFFARLQLVSPTGFRPQHRLHCRHRRLWHQHPIPERQSGRCRPKLAESRPTTLWRLSICLKLDQILGESDRAWSGYGQLCKHIPLEALQVAHQPQMLLNTPWSAAMTCSSLAPHSIVTCPPSRRLLPNTAHVVLLSCCGAIQHSAKLALGHAEIPEFPNPSTLVPELTNNLGVGPKAANVPKA